jgi:hypothetical protein
MKQQSTLQQRLCDAVATVTIGVCVFAMTPAQAVGTLIFKWVDKDGVVSYSQAAPTEAGAHDVTSFTVESLPIAQQRVAARMLANLEKVANAENAAREKRIKQADQKVETALERLQKAERQLSDGSTPTGADRVGNVGGHARLRESYFNRVTRLQDDVDKAQQTVNDAYALRDSL